MRWGESGTATPLLRRGRAAKGKRFWKFVVGGRDDMMVNILWKNLENVGRSGTERS